MTSTTLTAARCPGCFAEVAGTGPCGRCAGHGAGRRAASALPLGAVLVDQYVVGRLLGEPGGFGITYLAWDVRLETRVAIKEYLPREFAIRDVDGHRVLPSLPGRDDPFQWGLRSFLNEARALARFDHPNIVRIRTYFEGNGTAYIVMNYYDGLSLQALIEDEDRPLSEERTLALMLPVLDGLRQVHGQRLLHRDIKPANIYLANGRTPILLDFGAARTAVAERSRNLTEIYTEGFAPLEQYSSAGRQGPWTDVYACGATMYYLSTATTPPVATDRVLTDPLVPLRQRNPALSPAFGAAVERALAVRPADRPASVAEWFALLPGPGATRERRAPGPRTGRTEEGVPGGPRIVACGHCRARNRVPADRPFDAAACGRCGRRLTGGPVVSGHRVVRCARCKARNRLAEAAAGEGSARRVARCGRCGEPLPGPAP